MLKNAEIRAKAKEKGVKLYEVAAYMGKSQSYLTRKLYLELNESEKAKILSIIDKISDKQVKNA